MTTSPITPKFWHLDAQTRRQADPVRLQTNRYDIVAASFMEVEKVKSIYANCPRPNYRVAAVEVIIVDEDRERTFMSFLKDFRAKKSTPPTTADLNDLSLQSRIEGLFKHMTQPYEDPEYPFAMLLPTWHGTTSDAVLGICERNYEPTTSDRVDGGYFGAGIYSTFEADYAHRVYSRGALLLNWTAAGSTYYVLEKDKLHGDTLKYGFNSHFIPVIASTKNSGEYLATKAGSHTYTELVVGEKAACLPRYKVDLQPLIIKFAHFVGRESLLKQIHKACQSHRETVIYGPPKIGKSTLVNAYVNHYSDDYFFIWRIDCSNPLKFQESYNDLAGYLKTPQDIMDGTSLDIPEIHNRLRELKSAKPWLIIYDGLEEEVPLPENVHLLITTRNKTLLKIKAIEVPPLSEQEGIKLVTRLVQKTRPSEQHKRQLVKECGCYPSLLFQVATQVNNIEVFLKSPSASDIEAIVRKLTALEEHRLLYQMISRRENVEQLRDRYLTILEQMKAPPSWINELSYIPTRSGLRQSTLRKELKLRKYLADITTTDISLVRVQSSFWKEPRYLKPNIVVLDDQGNILKKYPKAAHHVASGYNGLLHFKQKPTQPLMEYAVFNLTSRLAGNLTPATELVSFEVQGKKYPVLISKTINGTPLREAINNPHQKFDTKQGTWHLLSALLMRPGDGHLSNYIVDIGNRIFCIDNDFAFLEPVVDKGKVFSDIYIQFFSALFCLKIDLDQDALKEFCALDIDAIILAWIEDVIKKEAQYLKLFPDPQEREALYKHEPNPGFKPSIMFQEGTLATIILQYWQLHDYISHALKHGPAVTLDGLLKQLIRLDKTQKVFPIGGHVSRAYANVEVENLYTALKKIKSTKIVESSMTLDQYQAACFGKPLSFQESEKKEFSPREAKEELFQTIVKVSSEFAETSTTLSKNFQNCTRPEWVLTAMAHRVQATTTHVVINKCSILTSARLTPFLHNHLVHLDVRLCSQIGNTAMRNIQASCPQLKELLISNAERLSAISTLFNGRLEFQNLEQLSISHCANLTTLALKATRLKVLKVTHNDQLVNTDFEAPSLSELDFRHSNKVILSPVARNSLLTSLAHTSKDGPKDSIFAHFPESLKKDGYFIFEVMGKKPTTSIYTYGHEGLKKDRAVALKGIKLLSNHAIELRQWWKWLDVEMKNDIEFVLQAIENGLQWDLVPYELTKNPSIALFAVQNGLHISDLLHSLEKEPIIALASLKNGSDPKQIDPELLKTKKFIREAVKINPKIFLHADENIRRDKRFVLEVFNDVPETLNYTLLGDEDRAWVIERSPLSFNKFREAAIEEMHKSNWPHTLLKELSASLLKDKKFICEIVKLDPEIYNYVDESFRVDRSFVLELAKANIESFQYSILSSKDRDWVINSIRAEKNGVEIANKLETIPWFIQEKRVNTREFILCSIGDTDKYRKVLTYLPEETLTEYSWNFPEEIRSKISSSSHATPEKLFADACNINIKLSPQRDAYDFLTLSYCFAITPNEKQLANVLKDQIEIWDIEQKLKLFSFKVKLRYTSRIMFIRFLSDGRLAGTLLGDDSIAIWDLAEEPKTATSTLNAPSFFKISSDSSVRSFASFKH